MLSLFEKVAGVVKAVNPDAFLSTEYPVDYFAIRFNHALFQPFDELVWHTFWSLCADRHDALFPLYIQILDPRQPGFS